MKISLIICLALYVLCIQCAALSEAACDVYLTCLNNGLFSQSTCRCSCLPNYNGSVCEKLICPTSDIYRCSSFNRGHCSDELIASYCPILCGACSSVSVPTIATLSSSSSSSSSSGSSSSSTSSSTNSKSSINLLVQSNLNSTSSPSSTSTSSTTTPCANLCVNNGIQNSDCSCKCIQPYFGRLCQQVDCTIPDSPVCGLFNTTSCSTFNIKIICPILCACAPVYKLTPQKQVL